MRARLWAWARRRRRHVVAAALVSVVVAGATLVWVRVGHLPPAVVEVTDTHPSVIVTSREGERLYEARNERGARGVWLAPDALPPMVVAATLAAEDHRFRAHAGVDPRALVRAAWRNLRSWGIVEGGSTITQQVVALAEARYGRAPARTFAGKLREAVLAVRVDRHLSKDEVLARYLAWAPYGNQVEGVARASTYYFGVTPEVLTPAQAAYLAALPNKPGRFNPRRDVSAAIPRQQRILRRMYEEGWISAETLTVALAERITIQATEPESIAPHWVRRILTDSRSPGTTIRTSLSASLQRTVLGILAAQASMLEAHHARQAAVVVWDNRTSEWLAWVTIGSDIDAAMTPRQPGSALKPFTYAAAFEAGWHPARILADLPKQFPTAEAGIFYSPRNYDGQFRGPMRARVALAGSQNVPAVELASQIGVPAVATLLRDLGITTLDKNASHYGLGLTLGNAEVRLDELVRAYAKMTSGIVENDARRRFSDRTQFWIADILSDPEAREYSFGEGSALDFPFTVAAKTGTSQAYHDNWTIGYTRDVTVGVWVGNLDRTPLRFSSGVTGAGPIFHDVMLAAVEHVRGSLPLFDHTPIVTPPDDLRETPICALSGDVAGEACPVRGREWLPKTLPLHQCAWHHASDRGVITVYPEPYRQWAESQGLRGSPATTSPLATPTTGTDAAATARATRRGSATPTAFRITSPMPGSTYLIDPTLKPEFQQLSLRAEGAVGRVEWSVNGAPVGASLGNAAATWPLRRGTHTITARDANGRTAEARVIVK